MPRHDSIFCMKVNPELTISQLKSEIEKRKDIPPLNQQLVYNGKKLEDNQTILSSGIRTNMASDDTKYIYLLPKYFEIQVSNTCSGNLKTLLVLNYKIGQVKNIWKQVTGNVCEFHLVSGGKVLDDSQYLGEYGIVPRANTRAIVLKAVCTEHKRGCVCFAA